jgi:hypothetical protein
MRTRDELTDDDVLASFLEDIKEIRCSEEVKGWADQGMVMIPLLRRNMAPIGRRVPHTPPSDPCLKLKR